MSNQTILIGRLVDQETNEREDGKKSIIITLAITRSYKNNEGVYETDFIPVMLLNRIADKTSECCKKGDLLAVKGILEMFPRVGKDDFQDGNEIVVVAEKVSFLSSNIKEKSQNE